MQKIKNCYRCGSMDVFVTEKRMSNLNVNTKYYGVKCGKCGTKIDGYFLPDTAIEDWNRKERK